MNNRFVLTLISSMLFGTLFVVPVDAGFYPAPDGTPLKVGDCTIVNDESQANATQVYTLNPTHVRDLNKYYNRYFERSARCSELQFHVDHNNSVKKVEKWLLRIVTTRFKSGYYNGNTVSTKDRHEWFWVENNVAHRIPDWLTGLSNGFLFPDRIALGATLSSLFYKHVVIGTPVAFNDGMYADTITGVWKNGDRDYANLPTQLANEIRSFVDVDTTYYKSIFSSCTFQVRYGNRGYWYDLDWSWMLRNPGCVLAES